MVDYRAESYKKRAAEVSNSRSGFKYFETSNGKVGASSGDVLISQGKKSDRSTENIIFSSGGSGSAKQSDIDVSKSAAVSGESGQKVVSSSTVSSTNPYVEQKTKVQVSAGVASQLVRQSLRDDATYTVGYTRSRPKPQPQSIDFQAKKDLQRKAETQKTRGINDLNKAQATPFINIVPAFNKAKETYNEFNTELKDKYEDKNGGNPFVEIKKGEVFISPDLLVAFSPGGLTRSALPVIKSNAKLITSNAVVKQTTIGKEVLSEARVSGELVVDKKILGVFPRFNYKTGFYTSKNYQVVGSVTEKGIVTDFTGLKSGGNIINTKGGANLLVKDISSGKSFVVRAETIGSEVGGVGNRRVSSVVKTGKESKTLTTDSFTERYVGKSNDVGIVGGSVSDRGVNVFVGEKTVELSGSKVLPANYYNSETGLVSATPTLELKQEVASVNSKVYNVKSAGQREVPFSAELSANSINSKLKSEFDITDSSFTISKGSVGSVAREQASSGGGLVSSQLQSSVGVFNTESLLTRSVESVEGTGGRLRVNPVVSSKGNGKSVVINDQKSVVQNSVYAGGTVSSNDSVSVLGRIGRSDSLYKSRSVVDVSTSGKSGSLLRSNSRSALDSGVSVLPASSIGSSLGQSSAVEYKPMSVQSNVSQSRVSPASFRLGFSSVPSKMELPRGGFKLSSSGGNGFGVLVKRRGSFVEIGRGLSKGEAVGLLKSRVGGTAARTGVITKGGLAVSDVKLSGFYNKKGRLIEQSRYAINTPGERNEISFEGIRISRRKF